MNREEQSYQVCCGAGDETGGIGFGEAEGEVKICS